MALTMLYSVKQWKGVTEHELQASIIEVHAVYDGLRPSNLSAYSVHTL